ncbi:hypothetical protein [Mycobacterium riyadhense]|nr:hypothetical protein [Mycobacterium riyadhense]
MTPRTAARPWKASGCTGGLGGQGAVGGNAGNASSVGGHRR